MRTSAWIIVGLVALALLGTGGVVVYTAARGLRNNNPGNIRRTASDTWRGMASEQTDPDFVQFAAPEWGIRAIAVTLHTYRERYGLRTIRQVLTRYAPSTENDTAAYIAAVSQRTGIGADVSIDEADLPSIVSAIISHENAANPYSLALIEKGVALALA